MINTIILGHALNILPKLPPESVSCVTTSPPYWGLRDYGIEPVIWDGDKDCKHEWGNSIPCKKESHHGEGKSTLRNGNVSPNENWNSSIKGRKADSNLCLKCPAWRGNLGLEPTFELYIKHLCQIFDEVKRVLRKDGTCFINIGDSYGGSGNASGHTENTRNLGYKTLEMGATQGHTLGLTPKSLCLIPQRFAIEMVNRGWILRNTIIWHKKNCMPSSAKDRFTVDFEYVYFFTKNKKYWFEQQFEKAEYLEVWSRKGSGPNTPYEQNNPRKRWGLTKHEIATKRKGNYTDPLHKKPIYPQGRNKRAVWTIPTKPFPEAHFAVYPEALIEPMIRAGCPEFVCKKCGKAKVKILKPIGYIENADGLSEKINNKPYSMQERKGYIAIRNLPTLNKIKIYLNKWRKIRDITIEEIEDKLESQAPHHWFSGESYPTKEDWLEIKELLGFDEIYDKQMIEEKYKPAEKLTGKYEEILSDCGCNAGWESGITLDPFMGAGTSALVALKQRKRFIGIEIKQEYIDMANKRIARIQQEIF